MISRVRAMKRLPWLVLLIAALAAYLRIYDLGAESLWLDEAYQVEASRNSVTEIVRTSVNSDTHPPLYYILQHFWMSMFGQSEVAARSLSAAFGVISVVITYRVGRALLSPRIGLWASFLMAISTFAIAMSQEGRPYSLLLMLTLLSYMFFIRLLGAEQRGKAVAFLYVITNILLCYTHLYGLLTIGSQVLFFALFWRSHAKAHSAFLISQAATLVAFSPWIFVFITRTSSIGIAGLNWIPELTAGHVLRVLVEVSGSRLAFLAFILLALMGLLSVKFIQRQGLVSAGRVKRARIRLGLSLTDPRMIMLLMWFLVPWVATIAFSLTVRPVFWDRYLIATLPALYLLVARGIDNMALLVNGRIVHDKVVTTIVLVPLIALLGVAGMYLYYDSPNKEQWREAAGIIDQGFAPGDAIVIYPDLYRLPFEYYYDGDPDSVIATSAVLGDEDSMMGKERLWFVLMTYSSTVDAPIKGELFARYGDSLMLERQFAAIAVYLFDIDGESRA